jgi:hypothetical protein
MVGDAQEGQDLVEDRFDIGKPADELILFLNPSDDADYLDFQAIVDPVVVELRPFEGVASVESYYDTGVDSMMSADRHVVIACLAFKASQEGAPKASLDGQRARRYHGHDS